MPRRCRDSFRTFELCQSIIAAGGTIANIEVHGKKVDLHLELLRDRNIAITTRLVDTSTIPVLFKTVNSHKINPKLLIIHRFKFDKILDAYEAFGSAAKTKALKVIIAMS
jgi:alcohol dehydrogenase